MKSRRWAAGQCRRDACGASCEIDWGFEMADFRMRCAGGVLEDWWVPPFDVHDGQAVTLYVPSDYVIRDEHPLSTTFDKLRSIAEISGKAICAEPASPPYGFWSWFKDHSASGWLRRVGGMSHDQAMETIRRLDLWRDDIRYLPGNFRLRLGMEAACAQNPDLLVFSTIAVDWTGMQSAFAMATSQSTRRAAIYLSFPFISQGRIQHHDFPGSIPIVISSCIAHCRLTESNLNKRA